MTTPRYIYDTDQEDHRRAQTSPDVVSLVPEPLKKDVLWALCREFIKDMDITCDESIYQNDKVVLSALEFIESIANIVGYKEE